MKLSCALVACNETTHYLEFWPIVKKAWWEIVGIPCIMIYIGHQLPEHLKTDPSVRLFKPIEGWPTATQAQVIRLLYPSLLACDGVVVISDMDILPLQRGFFINGFAQFEPHQFVSLRGIDEENRQVYMCYVGATPQIWQQMFAIQSEEDIRVRLQEWSRLAPADGQHGGQGWCTDQLILYMRVKQIQEHHSEYFGCLPCTPIHRLDRANPGEWIRLSEELHHHLTNGWYIDFHMPPYAMLHETIDTIVTYTSKRYTQQNVLEGQNSQPSESPSEDKNSTNG